MKFVIRWSAATPLRGIATTTMNPAFLNHVLNKEKSFQVRRFRSQVACEPELGNCVSLNLTVICLHNPYTRARVLGNRQLRYAHQQTV